MNGYQNAVLGDGEILFHEIGALLKCEAGRLRVSGCVGACATMGNQCFAEAGFDVTVGSLTRVAESVRRSTASDFCDINYR